MPWQDGNTVKKPFGRGIGLRKLEDYGIRVNTVHCDRFSANHQKIALRRMYILVKIDFKSEHYVIRVESVPVGKVQATAQFESVLQAIGRDLPRPGHGQLGILREAIDVN
jgi:hypothetical protein